MRDLTRRNFLKTAAMAMAAAGLKLSPAMELHRQEGLLPVGYLLAYGHDDLPRGWIPCDGSRVSRYDYPELFEVLGTHYGGEDPYFHIPDITAKLDSGRHASDTVTVLPHLSVTYLIWAGRA